MHALTADERPSARGWQAVGGSSLIGAEARAASQTQEGSQGCPAHGRHGNLQRCTSERLGPARAPPPQRRGTGTCGGTLPQRPRSLAFAAGARAEVGRVSRCLRGGAAGRDAGFRAGGGCSEALGCCNKAGEYFGSRECLGKRPCICKWPPAPAWRPAEPHARPPLPGMRQGSFWQASCRLLLERPGLHCRHRCRKHWACDRMRHAVVVPSACILSHIE